MSNSIYVHGGDYSEFLEYQKTVPDIECIYITDGAFLRGRTPAPIKVLPKHYLKWDSAEILEAINRCKPEWDTLIQQEKEKDDEESDGLYF